MVLFSKKIVCNLGNYESLALEVLEASSFEECDVLLDQELEVFNLKNRAVRIRGEYYETRSEIH